MPTEPEFTLRRKQMVLTQLRERKIYDERVLDAMSRIPRHLFVAPEFRDKAYQDGPLPIGENQTISQPYIVALMSQLLQLNGHELVLEIGTGCGYQTAVLCELANYVYSLERFPRLGRRAADIIQSLGYENVDFHIGDGSQGLVDMAPFDAIIVTAASPKIPGPLYSQLSPNNGRLVIPVGERESQILQIVHRYEDKFKMTQTIGVRFVPLIGRFGFNEG